MTFRTRILLSCLAAALIPLALLAAGARHTVRERVTQQYRDRVAASSEAVEAELLTTGRALDARLRAIARQLVDAPAWRSALLDPDAASGLPDFAPAAMTAAGLDFLLLLDDDGRVLSSGHFRNDYGRELPGLAPALLRIPAPALTAGRRADREITALVRSRAVTVGGRRFTLVGGPRVDSAFVTRLAGGWSDALRVTLSLPGGVIASAANQPVAYGDGAITHRIVVPFVDGATGDAADAEWLIAHSRAPLDAVVRSMDRWFTAAAAAAVLIAFLIAHVAAARVTRPLEQLARNAGRVELDRYDVRLATGRRDEIGTLSRLLERMLQRLRAGARALRDAERRATVGDMARQVNHDIRNGLLPIRNVVAHLTEVARETPGELPVVFDERAGTLHSGIGYLENLATNYARLTPRAERQAVDVNALLAAVLRDSAAGIDDRASFTGDRSLPRAYADPVALRRVVENLVLNALESLPDDGGRVSVTTRNRDGTVMIEVADTGTGMQPDELDRIFDDFYTTKERGTGLGLSIVRRLVADMGGRIGVRSEPGRGTTFTVELPAAGA